MENKSAFLFTYGTLMQGFNNPFAERLRSESEFVDCGYFSGMLYHISWYPGAIFDENSSSRVHGEVYQLSEDKELLKELDEYEDVFEDESTSLYLRKKVPVTLSDESVIQCWAYLYNQSPEGLVVVPGGDFNKYRG